VTEYPIHLFPAESVWCPAGFCGRREFPGYRRAFSDGRFSLSFTKTHWHRWARELGDRCVFHGTREEAATAAAAQKDCT
jgi:hypothetical protein